MLKDQTKMLGNDAAANPHGFSAKLREDIEMLRGSYDVLMSHFQKKGLDASTYRKLSSALQGCIQLIGEMEKSLREIEAIEKASK
jgi:hypothetical protein